MTPAEAFQYDLAMRWLRNTGAKVPPRDEDEEAEDVPSEGVPLTMDQQAQENGVGGCRRWL